MFIMDKSIQQKRCSPFNYVKQSEDTRCIKQTSHILLYAVISFVFKLLLLTLIVSNNNYLHQSRGLYLSIAENDTRLMGLIARDRLNKIRM
jgi:hypothetical protein